uniref:F5/8 type C domain-containing protein n=1 Tax=Esox lucius TaxID=8010 RepID=A0A6Q2XRZ2_ESOLU
MFMVGVCLCSIGLCFFPWGSRFGSYKKVVYREYDEGFKQAKTHPSWLGLLGPTIRGQEGETLVVKFKNMADKPHSLHAHGITYGKQSEGSLYFDNTSQFEKEDDAVPPGGEHTYYWEVTPDVVPQATDPTCLTHTYFSHHDIVKDYNSGLIGTLLICKAGSLDEDGEQVLVHQEYVILMGVFNENLSWYKPKTDFATATRNHVKHTINGYANGSLPGLSVCAHTSVSLHLVGMSTEPELFSVHINGQVLQHAGHRVSSVGLIAGTGTSANMTAVHAGRWLLSSHIDKHLEAGMHGFVEVRSCEGFNPPQRKLTIKEKQESQVWIYYIAAEEVVWDYAPNMPELIDGDYKLKYLKQSPDRIGRKYKKAVYTQYTNAMFTERAENKKRKQELGIIGPVIRAQIRDVIKIVFKNMATRPYSIYPHGLTVDKAAEGVNYPAGGNQTHGVQPGETYTYVWEIIEEDQPLPGDPQCVTRMYHSAVNTPRDVASGLVGPLLICKKQHAMFAVFDENKSWYLDENIASYSEPGKAKKDDPDFHKSNIMHTINGYVYESGQPLGFCNGEIVTWHVSSIGAHDYIQTATFYGHTFDLNDRTEDFLSLFPMTGETITMNMDNVGIWLLASLNSHETTKGLRVKFKDVECFRDYVYEYEVDAETDTVANKAKDDFSIWKPEDVVTAKEAEKEKEIEKPEKLVFDDETDEWAAQLNLRSFKNITKETDMEKLDLSMYDYRTADEPDSALTDTSLAEMEATNTSLAERDAIKTPLAGREATNTSLAGREATNTISLILLVVFLYCHKRRHDKSGDNERQTKFSKVVFRGYLDSLFSMPQIRGEMDEHLGILGPVIKAEVGQMIMVFFRNLASRPYSLHANGVSYTKQTEGLSYEDGSKYWYKYDNEVKPNTTYTYLWKVSANVGPTKDESDCRTWAYYSGVNPEKDIHSGLIGPLLVCRKGTLSKKVVDMREFMLLFMTFDESQSWYYQKNRRLEVDTPAGLGVRSDWPDLLKGLRMYSNQAVRWHLFNMGPPSDLHSVHFHGQIFLHKQIRDHTQAVYPLMPGGFATLEMLPSKPGLWQLETEVGQYQQKGMQTLFLVIDNNCDHPLGLISGSVKDDQITANDKRGYWEPHLARLNNQGKYNAWSTDKKGSWIQVDFQRPVVISHIETQGAKQLFSSHYVVNYTISYSTDKRMWIYYKGNSNEIRMTFTGNQDANQVQRNTFFPPLIGRFIRLHPLHSYNSQMVRMEYYGCELDGCSVPLGMERGQIEDYRITASSTASSWYFGPWKASLARLNLPGIVNAWQAESNNLDQWLQVELAQVKKITGIVTQGAKSRGKEQYVTSYLQNMQKHLSPCLTYFLPLSSQIFPGNTDSNGHVKNYIYPPIFSRFIRVIPHDWKSTITLRVELLGCDFE